MTVTNSSSFFHLMSLYSRSLGEVTTSDHAFSIVFWGYHGEKILVLCPAIQFILKIIPNCD